MKVNQLSDQENLKKITFKKLKENNEPINMSEITIYDEGGESKRNKSKKKKNVLNVNKKEEKKSKKEDKFLINYASRKTIIISEYIKLILKTNNIICIENELYKYDDALGCYKVITEHSWKVLIFECIKEKHYKYIENKEIVSIYNTMKIFPPIQVDERVLEERNLKNKRYINCINGTLDIKDMRLLEHSPKYYLFNVVNAKFDEEFNNKELKKTYFYRFINDITNGDKELINLLREILGYTFSNLNNSKKFFIFWGYSNTGKSVFLDLIEFIVGKQNTVHIPLQKLNDEKYAAQLYNKLLNTYNELPDEMVNDLGMIKAIVSENDSVTARNLYGRPFSFHNRATIIFATNSMPELNIKLYSDTEAYFNRIIIIPFLNKIQETEQDKNLYEKLKWEKDLIFAWSVKGVKQYIENGYRFSECSISEKCLKKYKMDEDIIKRFIIEKIKKDEDRYIFSDRLKKEFEEFLKNNGRKSINNKEFRFLKENIIQIFNVRYKRINRDGLNKWGLCGVSLK